MNTIQYNILIGSDHGGFNLKNKIIEILKQKKYISNLEDIGCYNTDSCDYPNIAKKLGNLLIQSQSNKKIESIGILICGTGIGISIAANKIKEIRCALIHDKFTAQMAKKHNHANCIALGEKVKYLDKIEKILESFFLTKKSQEKRHLNRIKKIEN